MGGKGTENRRLDETNAEHVPEPQLALQNSATLAPMGPDGN